MKKIIELTLYGRYLIIIVHCLTSFKYRLTAPARTRRTFVWLFVGFHGYPDRLITLMSTSRIRDHLSDNQRPTNPWPRQPIIGESRGSRAITEMAFPLRCSVSYRRRPSSDSACPRRCSICLRSALATCCKSFRFARCPDHFHFLLKP